MPKAETIGPHSVDNDLRGFVKSYLGSEIALLHQPDLGTSFFVACPTPEMWDRLEEIYGDELNDRLSEVWTRTQVLFYNLLTNSDVGCTKWAQTVKNKQELYKITEYTKVQLDWVIGKVIPIPMLDENREIDGHRIRFLYY